MTLNEYQKSAKRTVMYPSQYGFEYTAVSMAGEVGEYCNKVKKIMRGDGHISNEALAHELGDILWYVSQAARECGYELEEIAQMNLDKLADRYKAGTIKGSGDER